MKIMKKKSFYVLITLITTIGILHSCSKDQAAEPEPQPPGGNEVTAENVSYNNFTGALLQTKCSGCHSSGGGGSSKWTFSDYASVKDNGVRINNVVLVTGTMPIGGSLTANEKALLKAWFDRNMPEQ
ncbi:hypothetical protein SAMN05661044_04538 [Olivibacter domesticus]|uniref:Cytochrome c domain-containing protein n=2 Tax=Olivibacter domesticus TaxID=407022 RepID=A0A1H7WEB0_OLID1|nr:hypothetical protein SAMN05661044_04538 [Olivibacter domesticus]